MSGSLPGWRARPRAGLTERQYDAMSAIGELSRSQGRAPTMRELADRLGAHKSNVKSIVDALEVKGWAKREDLAAVGVVIAIVRRGQAVATVPAGSSRKAATSTATARGVRGVAAC